MQRFGQLNKMSGLPLTNLFNIINQFSESTLPMGVKFDTLTAHTGIAMRAIGAYGEKAKASGDMFLASSAGMEKMIRAMFSFGQSLSPMQTFGYQLAAGMNTAKDPLAGVLDAIELTPFERIRAQVQGLGKLGMTTDMTVMAMKQSGLKDEFVRPMRKMLGDPAFVAAFSRVDMTKGPEGVKDAFKGFAPDIQKSMADMATQMALSKDPLEQLVMLTKNSIDYLSTIAAAVTKPMSLFGFNAHAAASARDALRTSARGGSSNASPTK